MKASVLSVAVATVVSGFMLVGCAPVGPIAAPTTSVTPTPTSSSTPLALPQTPPEAWNSFAVIADASCKRAYEGLVEEDVAGPNVGKLKIRLTWEQAGENTMAYQLPNGDTGFLQFMDFYSCEAWHIMTNIQNFEGSIPPYSANLPLQVTFDHSTAKYETSQIDQNGNSRTLLYTIDDGVFSVVENLEEGSRTTLIFGMPNVAMTTIVNDFYADLYSG